MQAQSADRAAELQAEITKLQRDTIDLFKKMDQIGVSPQMMEELRTLKSEQQALMEELRRADLEGLRAQLAEIKSAQEKWNATPAAETSAAEGESAADAAQNAAINMAWVLLAGFLVMFMQAGFAMVETGFTRAKNAAHTMTMNLLDMCIGILAYWAFGFAIMFGNTTPATLGGPEGVLNQAIGITVGEKTWTLFGNAGWFLAGDAVHNGGIFALFLFQLAFAATANTICTGTLAERWKLGGFSLASIFVTGLIYPLYGHWVWGGGWLAQLGYWDFAGSSVVHLTGAVIAFVGGLIVGPRVGKYNPDGSSNPIPGHNLPLAFIGTIILAFGWFGFNAGSTLSGTDAQIGIIATNTALALGAGAVAAALVTAIRFGKPDPSFCCNGLLGGLVGITAPCAFVDAWAAVLIGAIAGALVVFSAAFIEDKCRIDDPVGAISVHGTCGIWGCLALGLFANGRYSEVTGLFYGNGAQFLIQALGVGVNIVTVGALAWIMFKIIDLTVGNRASDIAQMEGMDLHETGVEAYAEDVALRAAAPTRVPAVVPPPPRA